jgi:hypothetical protein
MELKCLTGLDELYGVLQRCGLVEAVAEGFASEGALRGVVATLSRIDVIEELASLFRGDASQTRHHWGTFGIRIVDAGF